MFKRLKFARYSMLMVIVLLSHLTVSAASPQEGIRGTGGGILSEVTTLAGTGEYKDREGDAILQAAFRSPEGILLLNDGSLLIADTKNHRIRKLREEEVTTFSGLTVQELDESGLPIGALLDGSAQEAVFNHPKGMAVDQEGNIYVADSMNHSIRKIDPSGNVMTLAGDGIPGDTDGDVSSARFNKPSDVAVAVDGTIYVADTLNHAIRRISTEGTVTTLNQPSDRVVEIHPGFVLQAGDFRDGSLAISRFNEPAGLVLDEKGNLYVADSGNHLIRYIDFSSQTVTTVAGYLENGKPEYEENALYATGGFLDGSSDLAKFHFPAGLAMTDEGALVIADRLNHAIRYLFEDQVSTLAGNGDKGNTNGIEGMNRLHFPADVAVKENGDIIIADTYNQKIRLFSLYRLPENVTYDGNIHIIYQSNVVPMDTLPEIIDSRTMVPVRAISETLGYEVRYDNQQRSIHIMKDQAELTLYVGQTVLEVKNDSGEWIKTMDVSPYIKEDRTYVPVRFFAEEFGLDVEWDVNTRSVILREPYME